MTILITGTGGGLGKAIAERLDGMGDRVVGISRRDADLSRMGQVRALAHEVASGHPDLKILINNAGVSRFRPEVTPDGLELTFATNYAAPFLLTNLLLPVLARNRGVVLNIGSEQHRWARAIPWDDLQAERRFDPIQQYSLTKLYLILFTRELGRRAPEVVASCISPGFLRTDLGRDARGSFRIFLTLARPFQRSARDGAKRVVEVLRRRDTGAYYRGARPTKPSKLALDDAAAARLWNLSADLVQLSHVG